MSQLKFTFQPDPNRSDIITITEDTWEQGMETLYTIYPGHGYYVIFLSPHTNFISFFKTKFSYIYFYNIRKPALVLLPAIVDSSLCISNFCVRALLSVNFLPISIKKHMGIYRWVFLLMRLINQFWLSKLYLKFETANRGNMKYFNMWKGHWVWTCLDTHSLTQLFKCAVGNGSTSFIQPQLSAFALLESLV